MKPKEFEFEELTFNYSNEFDFWKGHDWKGLNNEKLMELIWKIKMDAIYVSIKDAYNKKTTLKLPL